MKAAYLVGPFQYEVREVPDPQVPPDGLVLAVKACGVCGSDLRRWKEGPQPGAEPLIAGHEIAGVVVKAGAQVQDFSLGERLAVAPDIHCGHCYYCQRAYYNLCDSLHLVGITPGYPGGFAGQMVLTAEMLDNGVIHRIPDSLSDQEAALAEPLGSVLAAHALANTSLGDTVVVMGAGPIGCLHIAVAKARGARVILSDPSPVRRQKAAVFGPEAAIDPVSQDLVEFVRSSTAGVGADIAICANPVAATHAQAVELVRKRGKVVLFGGLPKSSPMTHLDANRIHYGEIEVLGSFSSHPMYHAQALEALQRGLVASQEIVTHCFSLDEVDAAFQMAAGGEALKVMLRM